MRPKGTVQQKVGGACTVEVHHLSEDDINKITSSLTPEEREFAALVDAGFKKMGEDVAEILNRLNIKGLKDLDSYSPILGLHADDDDTEKLSRPRLWGKKRVNRSLVVAFSKERDRILKGTSATNRESSSHAMLVTIIYAIVGPTNHRGVSVSQKRAGRNSPMAGPNRNDAYLFELGCYILFLLDIWHINRNLSDFREGVLYGTIIRSFLELFQESLGTSKLKVVLYNRLERYFSIFREAGGKHTDRMRSLFTELAKRCRPNAAPLAYDFEAGFPFLITNIMEEFAIATDWASTVVGMIEPLCNGFEFIYGRDSE